MKIKVVDNQEKVIYEFPCLMQTIGTGSIVLMTSKTDGVMIVPNKNSCFKFGDYSENWDIEDMIICTKTIELSN